MGEDEVKPRLRAKASENSKSVARQKWYSITKIWQVIFANEASEVLLSHVGTIQHAGLMRCGAIGVRGLPWYDLHAEVA